MPICKGLRINSSLLRINIAVLMSQSFQMSIGYQIGQGLINPYFYFGTILLIPGILSKSVS